MFSLFYCHSFFKLSFSTSLKIAKHKIMYFSLFFKRNFLWDIFFRRARSNAAQNLWVGELISYFFASPYDRSSLSVQDNCIHLALSIYLWTVFSPLWPARGKKTVLGYKAKKNNKYISSSTSNKADLEPRVSPAFAITYFCNHYNIRFENTSKYVDTCTDPFFQKLEPKVIDP